MKNTNDTIGNWTSNLSACSKVPQPTTPEHIPVLNVYMTYYKKHLQRGLYLIFLQSILVLTELLMSKKYRRTGHYTFFYICDMFMLQTYHSSIHKFHFHLLHKIFMFLHVSTTTAAIITELHYYQDKSSVLYISMVNINTLDRKELHTSGLLHSE